METYITPDRQYKFIIDKKPRGYSTGKYDQYVISINVTDITGVPKVNISCTELEFTRFLNDFNIYLDEFYGYGSRNLLFFEYEFSVDSFGNKINIRYGKDIPQYFIGSADSENPDDDDEGEKYLTMYINRISFYNMYVSNILHFKADIDSMTDFVLSGWNIIEDIPYVEELMYSDLLDTMRPFY